METNGAWWLSWSSKPVARVNRVVGSIPIRLRHLLMENCSVKFSAALAGIIFASGLHSSLANADPAYPLGSPNRSLTTRFTFTATVLQENVTQPAAPLDVWMPIPSNGPWQTVTGLSVSAPADYHITTEKTYGDRMVYAHFDRPSYPVIVSATFTVNRIEPQVLNDANARHAKRLPARLTSDNLVPTGGKFEEIAQGVIGNDSDPLTQERDLFRSVVANMTYDYKKVSPRYAMGDSAFVCDYKSGNCSDLHSYLISLSRSVGVPSVLEFGFPLTGIPVPDTIPTDGTITGYHCWAWFKDGKRWLPEDAADARRWQDIGRDDLRDYLFGNLLLPRSAVAVSRGRDIILVPPQKSAPLNYFIYPYAESNGSPIAATWSVAYHVVHPY